MRDPERLCEGALKKLSNRPRDVKKPWARRGFQDFPKGLSKRGDTEQPPPHHCVHHTILIIAVQLQGLNGSSVPQRAPPWSGFERFVLVGQG